MQVSWGKYQNGLIPLQVLAVLEGSGGRAYAHPAAAAAWNRMRRDCHAATGVWIGATEGNRPLGVKADQYDHSEATTSTGGSTQWYQLGRAKRHETPSAAYPGTSVHGEALAIDYAWRTLVAKRWVERNAHLYGFAVGRIPAEDWHIIYIGSLVLPAKSLNGKKDQVSYLIVNSSKAGAYRGDVVVCDPVRLTRKVGNYDREKAHCELVTVDGDVQFLNTIASFSGGRKAQYDEARRLGNNGTVNLITGAVYIAG